MRNAIGFVPAGDFGGGLGRSSTSGAIQVSKFRPSDPLPLGMQSWPNLDTWNYFTVLNKALDSLVNLLGGGGEFW